MTTMPAPQDLFAGERPRSWINQFWGPLVGGTLGFGAACYVNWATRRPVFSGVQKHILFTLLCGFAGTKLYEARINYQSEKDAVLKHYIELHPEDFPTPERKKWSEVLISWAPIR